MNKLRSLPFVFLCAFISATACATPPIAMYSIFEIPSIVAAGGTMSASAINDRDEVVGTATQPDGAPFFGAAVAFFYQHSSGAVNELAFDSEQVTDAFGVNDKGLIAGLAESPDPPQAVLWSSIGGAEGLGPFTIAMAVNNQGTVVGSYDCAIGGARGCASIWSDQNHVFTPLPLLPPPPSVVFCVRESSNALAINNQGLIVGWAESCGGGAVEWQNGTITLVVPDVVNESDSVATAVNDDGHVVGTAGGHAFIYYRGKLSDLGTLPGDPESSAESVNNLGEVVGWSGTLFASTRAFIYVNGQMYDLNNLIDPTNPLAGVVHLDEAVAINSAGRIAVNGTDSRDGLQHAYLLIRE